MPWRRLCSQDESERHLWISAQGNQFLLAVEAVLEAPPFASVRPQLDVQTIAIEQALWLVGQLQAAQLGVAESHGGNATEMPG